MDSERSQGLKKFKIGHISSINKVGSKDRYRGFLNKVLAIQISGQTNFSKQIKWFLYATKTINKNSNNIIRNTMLNFINKYYVSSSKKRHK